jgi:hypothetical protein
VSGVVDAVLEVLFFGWPLWLCLLMMLVEPSKS